MLPLKITICGFGPFKEEQIIDFTKLSGLFLISGNTGSGKSTIFDALIFALYGEASGSYRNPSSFRSNFCNSDDLSYVKLEFSHLNKKYLVERSPSYLRPKKRGEGLIREESKSELKYDDKIFATTKEVDLQMESILGIKAVQFKQIFMIAQNEFMELLIVNSDERSKILRKLFNTEKLETLQLRLKEVNKLKEDNFKNLKDSIINNQKALSFKTSDAYLNIDLLQDFLVDVNNYLIETQKELQKSKEIKITLTKQKGKLDQELIKQQNYENHKMQLDQALTIQTELASETDNYQKLAIELDIINEISKQIIPLKNNLDQYYLDLAKYQTSINENEKLKTLNEETLNIVTNKLTKETEITNEILSLEKTLNEIKLDKYQEKEKLENEIARFNSLLESKKIETSNNSERLIKINKAIFENENFINDNENVLNKITLEENKIKELYAYLKTLDEYQDKYAKLNSSKKILISKQKELANEAANLHVILKKYNDDNLQYNLQLAGILAEELENNKECPVCGSLNHPNPAKMTNKAITQDYIKSLKEKLDTQTDTLNKIKITVTKLEEGVNFQERDLEIKKQGLQLENIQIICQSTKEEIKVRENELISLAQISEKRKQSIVENQKFKVEKEKIDLIIEKLSFEISDLKDNLTKNETADNILKKELPYLDIHKARAVQLELSNKVKTLKENLSNLHNERQECEKKKILLTTNISNYQDNIVTITKSINDNLAKIALIQTELKIDDYQLYDLGKTKIISNKISNYNSKVQENKTKITLLDNEIKDIEVLDISKLIERINEIANQIIKSEETIETINKTFFIDQRYYNELVSQLSSYLNAEKELQDIKPLNDVINGKINSSIKLNFETYVQSFYFDLVLKFANIRLSKMSSSRYELKRQTENLSKSGKVGLDLEIQDAWNNKRRDVRTLSGGESFNASLALALGLSDVIKQNSGGIIVDAMFIDEGFGTLDTESLNKALGVLSSLDNSTKLLGIISHVSELKANIDQQIVVEKSLSGSQIKERGI